MELASFSNFNSIKMYTMINKNNELFIIGLSKFEFLVKMSLNNILYLLASLSNSLTHLFLSQELWFTRFTICLKFYLLNFHYWVCKLMSIALLSMLYHIIHCLVLQISLLWRKPLETAFFSPHNLHLFLCRSFFIAY